MPVHIPKIDSSIEHEPAGIPGLGGGAPGQLSDELVSQVVERVMALLLEDLRRERERRRAVGRPDRLKGVR